MEIRVIEILYGVSVSFLYMVNFKYIRYNQRFTTVNKNYKRQFWIDRNGKRLLIIPNWISNDKNKMQFSTFQVLLPIRGSSSDYPFLILLYFHKSEWIDRIQAVH